MKINYVLLVFAVLISALLSYGFILLPGLATNSGNFKIIYGINIFINFSLSLTIGLALSTELKRSNLLIKTVGFTAFFIAIFLFLLLRVFVQSSNVLIVISGLYFLSTLLLTYVLHKSKV